MKAIQEFTKKYSIVIVLLVLIALFGSMRPSAFLTVGNLFTILRQVSITGIMTVGLLFVMLAGGVDLSIGSMISFVCMLSAHFMVKMELNPVLSIILTLIVSILIGILMGTIIVKTRIFAMIGTIAASQILQGVAYLINNGRPISGLPNGVSKIAQSYVGPVPVPVIIFLVIAVLAAIVLNFTYIGRYFYFVGSNGEAARLSGISKEGVQILSYGICSFLTGCAGIIMLARVNSGQAEVGTGMEMDCLTAAVIGGVSLAGGEGKISKAITGILIMGVLSNGMIIINLGEYKQMIIKGLIFLAAVCFDGIQKIISAKVRKVG